MSYAKFQPTTQPPPLQDPPGFAWGRAHGLVLDWMLSQTKQAVKQRFPSLAAADALGAIGDERLLTQGANEAASAFAQRVRTAWDAWQFAGTAQGVLEALRQAGYPNVALEGQNGHQFTWDGTTLTDTALPAGAWFIGYDQLAFWNNFQVLFFDPLPLNWITSLLGPQFHFGTSTASISWTGSFSADYRIVVVMLSNGAAGVAQYKWSSDYGRTYSGTLTTPGAGNVALGATGVLANFAALGGVYSAGDIFTLSPQMQVPASTDPEALLIKRIVTTWMPAFGRCRGYVIPTQGEVFGYRGHTFGGANAKNLGFIGGSARQIWT